MRIYSVLLVVPLLLSPERVPAQTLGGCAVFPADNIWNTPVDTLPVQANSATLVNTIGPTKYLHPDFSGTPFRGVLGGIPYVLVPGSQPRVPISFTWPAEADPGPYPVPPDPPIEGGPSSTGDRHILIVDTTNCVLYELFAAYPNGDGSWRAGSGAIFDLKTNALRPRGWTSADAAGLPILPGLVRYDEVAAGEIRHAIRFTAPQTRRQFIWPARHYASSLTGTQYPPMGQRFRLKAAFDITSFSPEAQVILRALKKYGMILSDNGSSWYITGVPDTRWNDDELHRLHQVLGSNFEAVDTSGLMVDPDSAQVAGSAAATLTLLTVSPATVAAGRQVTIRATLGAAAPAGGAVVSLSSSNSSVVAVPASLTVSQGQTSASLTVTTGYVPSSTTVTVSAFHLGLTRSAVVTVTPSALSTLALNPSSVLGTGSVTGTVTLTGAAPAGGAVIVLSSSNTAAAAVPAQIVIAQGSASATFTITTSAVASTATSVISASYAGAGRTATLTVTPAVLNSFSLSKNIVGGTVGYGRLQLSGAAPPAGISVSLTSSSPALSVPATVRIASGASSAGFTVHTNSVAAKTSASVAASLAGVTKTSTVSIIPLAVAGMGLTRSSVTGGSSVSATVRLNGPAPAAGVAVTLSSSNTEAARTPATVRVPAGFWNANFSVQTSSVAAATAVTISGSYGGAVKTAVLQVNP